MAAQQYLPIPKNIKALACETINRRIGRLPFTTNGIEVTEDLIAVTLECLNSETKRTLPFRPVSQKDGLLPGLADCLSERIGGDQNTPASVIADVLIDAGLAEPAETVDTATHVQAKGIRLLSPWTWHIASGDVPPCDTAGFTGSETDAWLAKCPICRTGILSQVTGKRLFGIPPTDYFLDCSHCGAKFVPEKDRFRLVSIAKISDPRWRQYLNSCKKPDEWAALVHDEKPVRKTSRISTSGYRVAQKKIVIPAQQPVVAPRPAKPARQVEGIPVTFSTIRDGSLTVSGAAKTFYFKPVSLRYLRGVKHDLFTQSQRIVQEVLEAPAFSDIKPLFTKECLRYLPLRLGPVTEELRQKNTTIYRQLLNKYGDEDFCSFEMQDETLAKKKGVLLVYVQGKLCHIAACHSSYDDLINHTFGNISADQCYIDGDEMACRINCISGAFRNTPVFWLHELSDDKMIDDVVSDLRGCYFKDLSA
ncbi:MAG TPA: hypothetical protein PKM50_08980 [Methanoregula sp.]|nr:hypothetical protein [Methanoregula sp.]